MISNQKFEELYISYNRKLDSYYIICINDTYAGLALGGCRLKQYDHLDSACAEAKKLAAMMSLKSSFAGLPLGGGKAIIFPSEYGLKHRRELFLDFAQCINQFDGKYITSVDEGVFSSDLETIAEISKHVIGQSATMDPAYYTALGVYQALLAAAYFLYHKKSLADLKINLKGIGKVGYHLLKILVKENAELRITDKNSEILSLCQKNFPVEILTPENIHLYESDFFVPCSSSGTLTRNFSAEVNTKVIAGAENNQIAYQGAEERLQNRGIFYLPDYVVNSGGLICAAALLGRISAGEMEQKIKNMYNCSLNLLERVSITGLPATMLTQEQIEIIKRSDNE